MKAPDRIWLQWHGDVWDLDSLPALDDSTDGPSEADVTWASHEVFDADVEYVRRDAPAPAPSGRNPQSEAAYLRALADEVEAGRAALGLLTVSEAGCWRTVQLESTSDGMILPVPSWDGGA